MTLSFIIYIDPFDVPIAILLEKHVIHLILKSVYLPLINSYNSFYFRSFFTSINVLIDYFRLSYYLIKSYYSSSYFTMR